MGTINPLPNFVIASVLMIARTRPLTTIDKVHTVPVNLGTVKGFASFTLSNLKQALPDASSYSVTVAWTDNQGIEQFVKKSFNRLNFSKVVNWETSETVAA